MWVRGCVRVGGCERVRECVRACVCARMRESACGFGPGAPRHLVPDEPCAGCTKHAHHRRGRRDGCQATYDVHEDSSVASWRRVRRRRCRRLSLRSQPSPAPPRPAPPRPAQPPCIGGRNEPVRWIRPRARARARMIPAPSAAKPAARAGAASPPVRPSRVAPATMPAPTCPASKTGAAIRRGCGQAGARPEDISSGLGCGRWCLSSMG